ncbi:unnamed protein product [Zymoseptoria tritici ST99CH_1A5]|uniref:Uncharacterized protein n=3 Tax=Zymoseptoria tritici TaxID=1047171 RepID=A0A1X7RG18_ZYMT9|nr:unnamed protein product [Zymoseptoria tritici ST99CH_3D7]SMR42690.1 unnamed protein product [Zymoseptoria tritici ST99CH_1E4]SMY20029.1 unnamed protein product [Zymoseptoria tritici ST99CH_1A5]
MRATIQRRGYSFHFIHPTSKKPTDNLQPREQSIKISTTAMKVLALALAFLSGVGIASAAGHEGCWTSIKCCNMAGEQHEICNASRCPGGMCDCPDGHCMPQSRSAQRMVFSKRRSAMF